MTTIHDVRDRYRQIAAELRADILAGELAIGAQLPSTYYLMKTYDAASTTVQRALSLLKNEGLVISRAGKGTYVRERPSFVINCSTTYFKTNQEGWSYDLLRVAEEVPPTDVASALRLTDGAPAMLRYRLARFAGEPVDLSWYYYPLDIVRNTPLTGQNKIRGGAPCVLAELGFPQRHFIERISARMPTTEEMERLELPDEVPVIRQLKTVYSDNDRPVEAGVLIKGAHHFDVEYREAVVS